MNETDYIIVGAGSAGCVLANRLSENAKHRVTVLEAGGSDRRFFVQMPLGYGKLFYNPSVNWLYAAEPDPGLAGSGRSPAARQAVGRLVVDQRHGLYPRASRGLRRLGRSGAGVGLGKRAGRLSGDGGYRGRRGRLARRGRAAVRLHQPQGTAPDGGSVRGRLRRGGAGPDPGFQRGGTRGRRDLPD